MITEEQILSKIDNYQVGDYYCQFINLGDVYSYLIDSRLNIFIGENDRWAIVAERLGYNPRAGGIMLDLLYFGNCLSNLESYNEQHTNYYSVFPIEWNDFNETVEGESLKADAKYWNIRGKQIELSHDKQDYINANIELKEDEPDKIRLEEVGRLLLTQHQNDFRATDQELYKSIPQDLKKILVIDEWYHRDFNELSRPELTDEQLRETYEFNKNILGEDFPMDYESFVAEFKQGQETGTEYNESQWENNRPSSYETWQLIAEVIASGDPSLYQPTQEPNSHWKNWPDSGSM